MSGITTMLGGGTGPATGTNATTCTPGIWHLGKMLQSADAFPMNLGFMGKGNASLPGPLDEQVIAGAMGLKLTAGAGRMLISAVSVATQPLGAMSVTTIWCTPGASCAGLMMPLLTPIPE